MGTAAKFARVVTDLDHPNLVAVLLAEQRQRAHRPRLADRRIERPDVQIADQYLIDLIFDIGEHIAGHRPDRGEVEPEPAR